MNGDKLRSLLAAIQVVPNRQLGQNFLIDEALADWIVDQLDPQPDDLVVEVGPGTGALTRRLIERCGRLMLIEKDKRLADYLRGEYFRDDGSIEILNIDAVDFDKRPLFLNKKVKLIGNLPYSAATPIMRNFLEQPTPVTRAVLMLQKEVGDRMVATAGTKAYGKLGIRIQSEWNVEVLRTAEPELFHPRPQVDSSILLLEPRSPDSLPYFSKRQLDEISARGFAQRRKQLKKNLGLSGVEWGEIAQRLNFNEQARAEELSLEQWIKLANELDNHPVLELPEDCGGELFDVVDEHDEVVKQATRGEVHREGWRHRAVHIFVVNKKGDLYLQKRSPSKDSQANRWDSSAAGHLDAGENYQQAAERELYEELMVTAAEKEAGQPLREVARIEACEETGWEFTRLYVCEASGKIRTHGKEISCGAYFPLPLIDKWVKDKPSDFAPSFLQCLKAFHDQ